AAGGPGADARRLGPAVGALAPAPRRADRAAGAAARRPDRLHRVRLPVASPLPALQPRRRAGPARAGSPAADRRLTACFPQPGGGPADRDTRTSCGPESDGEGEPGRM